MSENETERVPARATIHMAGRPYRAAPGDILWVDPEDEWVKQLLASGKLVRTDTPPPPPAAAEEPEADELDTEPAEPVDEHAERELRWARVRDGSGQPADDA